MKTTRRKNIDEEFLLRFAVCKYSHTAYTDEIRVLFRELSVLDLTQEVSEVKIGNAESFQSTRCPRSADVTSEHVRC